LFTGFFVNALQRYIRRQRHLRIEIEGGLFFVGAGFIPARKEKPAQFTKAGGRKARPYTIRRNIHAQELGNCLCGLWKRGRVKLWKSLVWLKK